jgi:hypothetical protein
MLPVVVAAGMVATVGDLLPPLAALLSAHGARLSDGRDISAAHMRVQNAHLRAVPLTAPLNDTEMYLHIAVREINRASAPIRCAGAMTLRACTRTTLTHVRDASTLFRRTRGAA